MPVFLWERAWPAGLQVAVPAGKCLLPCPGPNRSRKTGRRLPGIRAAILAVCCPEGALPPQTACAVGEPAVAQVPGSMRGHPGTAVSGCWRYLAAWPGGGILWRCPPVVRRYGHMETGRSSALLPPVMTCSAAPAAGRQRSMLSSAEAGALPAGQACRPQGRDVAGWEPRGGGGRPFPGGKITAC